MNLTLLLNIGGFFPPWWGEKPPAVWHPRFAAMVCTAKFCTHELPPWGENLIAPGKNHHHGGKIPPPWGENVPPSGGIFPPWWWSGTDIFPPWWWYFNTGILIPSKLPPPWGENPPTGGQISEK